MEQKKILWVRLDAIGDNILSASMLPYIYEKYERPHITVVCQQHIAELYEPSPFVREVIGVDKMRLYLDSKYRNDLLQRLQQVGFDLAFDTTYSWDEMVNFFVVGSLAKERITFKNRSSVLPSIREKMSHVFTRFVDAGGIYVAEMDRYVAFLAGIDIKVDGLHATIWTTAEDERFAEKLFAQNNLDPRKTITLFAFGRSHLRTYPYYGTALSSICREYGFSVVGLGDGAAYGFNQACMNELGVGSLNLSGKTTLRQTAAILRRCRLAVGAETGVAHMACAVEVPNVIVYGGGNFGRFMPYSSSTSLVSLPLDCYWCDWVCKYEYSHCVVDIAPEVLNTAIRQTLDKKSEKPRLFLHAESSWRPEPTGPSWKMVDRFVTRENVEIIPVELDQRSERQRISKKDLESKFSNYRPKVQPEEVASALRIASELRDNGKTRESLEVMEKAIENNAGFPELLNFKAELQIELGMIEDATSTLWSIITLSPFHTDAMNNLVVLDIMRGRYESALGLLQKILEIDSSNKVALSNLHYIENELALRNKLIESEELIIQGDYPAAREFLMEILSINDKHEDAILALSVLKSREGNYSLALKDIQRVLNMNPDNEYALQLMQKLLLK